MVSVVSCIFNSMLQSLVFAPQNSNFAHFWESETNIGCYAQVVGGVEKPCCCGGLDPPVVSLSVASYILNAM